MVLAEIAITIAEQRQVPGNAGQYFDQAHDGVSGRILPECGTCLGQSRPAQRVHPDLGISFTQGANDRGGMQVSGWLPGRDQDARRRHERSAERDRRDDHAGTPRSDLATNSMNR